MSEFKCFGCGQMRPMEERNRISISIRGIDSITEVCSGCLE